MTDFANDPRIRSSIYDPQHWEFRAEEMRTLADGAITQLCREAMLNNAKSYDRLAQWAARRRMELSSSAMAVAGLAALDIDWRALLALGKTVA